MDTVVWQLIASVAAPGFTIHTIVGLANTLLETAEVHSEMPFSMLPFMTCTPAACSVWPSSCNSSVHAHLSSSHSYFQVAINLSSYSNLPVRLVLDFMQQSEQLTASLSATAVLLGLPAEIFISTINKSIPTAIGLLGELDK